MDKGKFIAEGKYEEILQTNPEIFKIIEEEEKQLHEAENIESQLDIPLNFANSDTVVSPLVPRNQNTPENSNNSPPSVGNIIPAASSLHNIHSSSSRNIALYNGLESKSTASHEHLYKENSHRTRTFSEHCDMPIHDSSHHSYMDNVDFHFGAVRSASSISSLTKIDMSVNAYDLRKEHLKTQISKENGKKK
jgi:hypothetical protein